MIRLYLPKIVVTAIVPCWTVTNDEKKTQRIKRTIIVERTILGICRDLDLKNKYNQIAEYIY